MFTLQSVLKIREKTHSEFDLHYDAKYKFKFSLKRQLYMTFLVSKVVKKVASRNTAPGHRTSSTCPLLANATWKIGSVEMGELNTVLQRGSRLTFHCAILLKHLM